MDMSQIMDYVKKFQNFVMAIMSKQEIVLAVNSVWNCKMESVLIRIVNHNPEMVVQPVFQDSPLMKTKSALDSIQIV